MGQSGEGSPRAFRNRGIKARKAAQIEFVDHEQLGDDPLAARLAHGRSARDRLRRVRAAVLSAGEHRGMQPERAVEAEGVGVGEQFGDVETLPSGRIIRALNPEAVARAVAEPGRQAAKHAAGVAVHRRAKNLAIAVI